MVVCVSAVKLLSKSISLFSNCLLSILLYRLPPSPYRFGFFLCVSFSNILGNILALDNDKIILPVRMNFLVVTQ